MVFNLCRLLEPSEKSDYTLRTAVLQLLNIKMRLSSIPQICFQYVFCKDRHWPIKEKYITKSLSSRNLLLEKWL